MVSCDFCVIHTANACWQHCPESWHPGVGMNPLSDSPQPENAYGESERLGQGYCVFVLFSFFFS